MLLHHIASQRPLWKTALNPPGFSDSPDFWLSLQLSPKYLEPLVVTDWIIAYPADPALPSVLDSGPHSTEMREITDLPYAIL